MPWDNRDMKMKVIQEAKKYYSYESPFPAYDIIKDYNLENINIYQKLNIKYNQNNSLINKLSNKYITDWNPINEDNGIEYSKNPIHNVAFPEYDAFILNCIIRNFKPKKIIEIGSGWSTRIMTSAVRKENLDTHITCIDKYTTDNIKNNLKKLNVTFLDKDIVTIDLSFFDSLSENDILFIDSSHVLKNYGDVELEFLRILPSLNKGVIVHVHDIFLPYNYPTNWILDWKCVLTEQQILAAFLHNNSNIEILSGNYYRLKNNIEIPEKIEHKVGGSFWFKII
jgi:predicted O-methyltransferase YrrM